MADETKNEAIQPEETEDDTDVQKEPEPAVDPNGEEYSDQDALSMVERLLGGDEPSNPVEQASAATAKPEEEKKPEEKPTEEKKVDSTEKPKTDEKKDDSKPEEKPEEKATEIVIGDELIAEYPVLKGLRGKNLVKELPKHYNEAAKKIYQQGQEIAQLKKQLSPDKKMGVLDEEKELPDPIDDEEGYRLAVREQERARIKAELEKPVEDQGKPPIMRPAELINAIQVNLPKEITAKSIIDEYAKNNADLYYDEYGQIKQDVVDYFDQNPMLFIRTVLTSYQVNVFKSQAETLQKKVTELETKLAEKEKTTIKEVKTKAYEQTKKNLADAKTRPPEGSEVNLTARQEPELNENERLYAEIIKNNE